MVSGNAGHHKKNKTFTMAEVKRLMNEELDSVTQDCVRHGENLQEEDFSKEMRWDKIFEPVVTNLQIRKVMKTMILLDVGADMMVMVLVMIAVPLCVCVCVFHQLYVNL
jgi:hypothetical protein